MTTPIVLTIRTGTASRITEISSEEYVILQRVKMNLPDILTMMDQGVFDFKRGRALIHRDADGQLRKIELELIQWSNRPSPRWEQPRMASLHSSKTLKN